MNVVPSVVHAGPYLVDAESRRPYLVLSVHYRVSLVHAEGRRSYLVYAKLRLPFRARGRQGERPVAVPSVGRRQGQGAKETPWHNRGAAALPSLSPFLLLLIASHFVVPQSVGSCTDWYVRGIAREGECSLHLIYSTELAGARSCASTSTLGRAVAGLRVNGGWVGIPVSRSCGVEWRCGDAAVLLRGGIRETSKPASRRVQPLGCCSWDTGRSMDGEEATAWSGAGESRQLESVTFGYARVKGLRDHPIEDYHVARMQSLDGNEIGLFAVFDGHAGTEVASYLEQELFDKILAHPNFKSDPKETIKETYFAEDKRILDKAESEKGFMAGSTATTAFLLDKGHRLIVANVGDSRAVLARNGQAIEVSVDHEPQKPEEREMVESKGGEVAISPIGGVYRVDKRLNMSRAFGDYIIKEHLSVEPDIWDNILTDEDDFFIVASDGLWKVMDNDEAVEHVLAQESAEGAAKVLAAAALRRGSRDDISVLVVCLKDLSTLTPREKKK